MTPRRRYGVVGNPVRHSLSPAIHRRFAAATQKPLVYAAYQPASEDNGFENFVRDFFARGGYGLNITLPFKARALAVADTASARAQRVGAANVLARRGDKTAAYNTDGAGFISDLKTHYPAGVAGQKILIIGAGGAAQAVAHAIADAKPAALWIINRTHAKAQALATATGGEAVKSAPGGADIVINTTSAAHTGSALDIDITPALSKAKLAYDISYGSAAQAFLTTAKNAGAKTACDGMGMLIWQAALSFAIWEQTLPTVYSPAKFL